ncbi:Copper-transporting ATPase PAA1, chloroplastic [Glycine soja]|uniref:Copper-transporting ATPase PAA1, chloroplastic n=1 Tax=Glycine soja TaxID=3848 RepID=A0A445JGD1_GLYSO|nr:Copper-transporting ATPase PAA1, chloroplastic [Glycine soja]
MSSSLSIPIPFPIAMDSASSLTVTQIALFKPLKQKHHFVRGRVSVIRPLHRRLNSVSPPRCSSAGDDAVITLHVGGMMCEGCTNSVKKILESRPQVLSAHVNLTSETATVSLVPEQKTAPDGLKQLGEELAQHLTTCGFTSTLRGMREVPNGCFCKNRISIYLFFSSTKQMKDVGKDHPILTELIIKKIAAEGVLITSYKGKRVVIWSPCPLGLNGEYWRAMSVRAWWPCML